LRQVIHTFTAVTRVASAIADHASHVIMPAALLLGRSSTKGPKLIHLDNTPMYAYTILRSPC
jgi:hypothetical protein